MIEDTIKNEYQSIQVGSHFWCQTHLSAIPVSDRSLDPRYCKECFEFLMREASLLPTSKRPAWRPKNNALFSVGLKDGKNSNNNGGQNSSEHLDIEYQKQPEILSTEVKAKRGRKPKILPKNLIQDLKKQGLGSKRIAGELARKGIFVNYRTIARMTS
jgi:hypothetical protein